MTLMALRALVGKGGEAVDQPQTWYNNIIINGISYIIIVIIIWYNMGSIMVLQ